MVAHNLRIHGKVQGVGYRMWAAREASLRDIDGWVRNRADGTVEILASGGRDQVNGFVAACREGPISAHVSRIDINECAYNGGEGFRQLPTL